MRRGRKGTLREELRGLKESVRDKTIDKLCADLCAIGLDACMVERGKSEERVIGGLKGGSLGLIQVGASPIRWVNVLRHETRSGGSTGGAGWPIYTNVYLVPAHGTGRGRRVELKSVRAKSVPLSGRVIDVRWKANFKGDLIRSLNEDLLLKQNLIRAKEDVTIRSFPDDGYWTISSRWYQADWLLRTPRQLVPSREQWDCYEAIARHLLRSSKETGTVK